MTIVVLVSILKASLILPAIAFLSAAVEIAFASIKIILSGIFPHKLLRYSSLLPTRFPSFLLLRSSLHLPHPLPLPTLYHHQIGKLPFLSILLHPEIYFRSHPFS